MGVRRFSFAILLFIGGDAFAAKADSLRKIERLASIEFHRILNKHRAAQNIAQLGWDDTLWAACHNHNVWMMQNGNLNHHEKKGTSGFTGDGPGERYVYAAKGGAHRSWSGENCLYNYSADGSTVTEIARSIAVYSFNQWKNSPGHNRNMFNPNSRVHGVAFLLDDGKVWATDLFASGGEGFRAAPHDDAAMPFSAPIVIDPPAKAAPAKPVAKKQVKLNIKETEQNLYTALLAKMDGQQQARHSKAMGKAALKHAEYLAAYRKTDHKQAKNKKLYYAGTPAARVRKASNGLSMLAGGKGSIVEAVAVVTVEADELDLEKLAGDILAMWEKDAGGNGNVINSGVGVKIKRVKNTLTVYAVRVSRIK